MKNVSKRSLQILIVVQSVILVLLSATAGVMAKYVTEESFTGSVTIQADLGVITVKEHEAVRQDDGSYELDTAVEVTANSYTLIPGLDVPKDPFVTVTNKSPIEAYVFVEVVSTLDDSAITYEIDTDNWTKLEDVSGKNSGTVYVYNYKVTGNIGPIYILKNKQVTVGQKLLHMDTVGLGLTFYASMGQVAAGNTHADVYNSLLKD